MNSARFTLWATVFGSLAAAILSSPPAAGQSGAKAHGPQAPPPGARRTTDPPIPSRGKLGQELFDAAWQDGQTPTFEERLWQMLSLGPSKLTISPPP